MTKSPAGGSPASLSSGRLVELLGLNAAAPPTGPLLERATVHVDGIEAPNARMVSAALRDLQPGELDRQLARMLDCNLFALCADAWSQVRRVRDGLRRSRAEPLKEQPVDLPGHTLEAKLKPSLVVTLAGVDWCHVNFEFTAKLKITAATLQLLNGALVGLRFAGGEALLSLACEGHELQDFKRTLTLLPEIRLKEAIPLGSP